MVRLLLTLSAFPALALSGCLGESEPPSLVVEPSGVPLQSRGEREFWMVWVHGNETRERVFGVMGSTMVCSIAYSHELDPQDRVLRYDERMYGEIDANGTRAVIALDVFEAWGSCPIAYRLVPDGDAEVDLRRGGRHSFTVHDDGAVSMGGRVVRLGERGVVTYTAYEQDGGTRWRIDGRFVIENLGAWPAEALVGK